MQTSQLHTKRLILRRPEASDLAAYTAYGLSDRTKYVGGPFTPVQSFEKLAAMIGHWTLRGFGRFVFVDRASDRPIGHVGALQLDPSQLPEITWTIWTGADEGKGYAAEAARAFMTYAAQELGFTRMTAHVHRQNLASQRVAERLGGVLNRDVPSPNWMPEAVIYEVALSA